MPTLEAEAQAARRQLERVLQSPGFARNERLSRFLRFVVERNLQGKDHELKESVIATEVLRRRADYDPKHDPIVRTEAGRLRARLSEYYLGEGKDDALVIELPKGGYTPRFRRPGAERQEQRARPRRMWLVVALAGLAVALAATGWWRVRHESAPIAIAVLPLHDLSQDSANDYFADGLTLEIIRNLSVIDGLAVRSQTSSFAFKGKPRNVREVAKELGADYILEGSVLRAGQQLRINVQFIRARDDFPLWSGRFDREFADVFAIQDEISRGIVNSLRLKLGRGQRRYETNAEAYDLYLRACALQIQYGVVGYDQSIPLLDETVAKDPSFAPAYASLAVAHTFRSGQFRFDIAEELARMRAAAQKAIQLDPLLAEAHYALGMTRARDAQWEQSEESFRRAIELDPNRTLSYGHFAFFLLFPVGRTEEALEQLRIAETIDPLSPMIHFELAFVLMSARRYDEAADHCQKLPQEFPLKSYCLGEAWLGQGRITEAIHILETELKLDPRINHSDRGPLGCAYVEAGRREEAEKLAAASAVNLFILTDIFACLGDKERTFEALDRAAVAGPFRMGRVLVSPRYALLRGDPRLQALRKKVGLPE
jgi:serine/threonine-protein kinase